MTVSSSLLAYSDCITVLDQAVEAKNGARVKVTDIYSAQRFRMRLHMARTLTRKENSQIYEKGHPQFGRSIYDGLVVRIREIEDGCWVYIEKCDTRILAIEEIADGPLQIEYTPQRALPEPEPQRLLAPPLVRRRI